MFVQNEVNVVNCGKNSVQYIILYPKHWLPLCRATERSVWLCDGVISWRGYFLSLVSRNCFFLMSTTTKSQRTRNNRLWVRRKRSCVATNWRPSFISATSSANVIPQQMNLLWRYRKLIILSTNSMVLFYYDSCACVRACGTLVEPVCGGTGHCPLVYQRRFSRPISVH